MISSFIPGQTQFFRSRPLKNVIYIYLLLVTPIAAQYTGGATEGLFSISRQPNARLESMGRTGVAAREHIYAGLQNPAAISGQAPITINYAADPQSFYMADDENWYSDYYGVGINYRRWSYSLNYYRKDLGSSEVSLTSHILAYNFSDFLTVGVTAKKPDWSTATFDKQKYHYDVGGLLGVEAGPWLGLKNHLNIGLSVSNITGQGFTGSDNQGLPQIIRGGASLLVTLNSPVINSIEVAAEIHYITNSTHPGEDDFSHHWGTELTLFEILLIRGGYYWKKEFDGGKPSMSRDHISDLTYGLGLILFWPELTERKIPVEVVLAFTRMQQPSFVYYTDDWGYFYIIDIEIRIARL